MPEKRVLRRGCLVAHGSIRTDRVINGNELPAAKLREDATIHMQTAVHVHVCLCFHTASFQSGWRTCLSADSELKVKEKHLAPLVSEHNSAKWAGEGTENSLKWSDRSKKER